MSARVMGVFLMLCAAGACVSCGGGGGEGVPQALPSPNCDAEFSVLMVAPLSGATVYASPNPVVEIAANGVLPATFALVAVPSPSPTAAKQHAPTPMPSVAGSELNGPTSAPVPSVGPIFTGAIYYDSTFAGLALGTTYTLDVQGAGCLTSPVTGAWFVVAPTLTATPSPAPT